MKGALAVCLALSLAACGTTDSGLQPGTTESTTSQARTSEATEPIVSTSTASSAAGATSILTTTIAPPTTNRTVEPGVVLAADGLGLVDFGGLFEVVVAKLEAVLGPSTLTEHVEPNSPSRTEFHVYWQEAGLHIGFSTHPFFRSDGKLHFTWWHTWTTTPPEWPLETAAGVGWGSTLSELEDAYGDRIWIHSDECAPPGIIVPEGDVSGGSNDEDGRPRWILVGFDQPEQWTDDGSRYFDDPDSTRVAGMEAGASDGC